MAGKRITKLATVGEIATGLGVPVHRVQYILRSRPHIQPRARAGNAFCYGDAEVAAIRHELNAIDARRGDERESR